MKFNMTWEIGVLIDSYAEKVRPLESEQFDYMKYQMKEDLQDTYSKAIELTMKDNCGLIMPIDECINWVEGGSINDYDGHGYLLDKDGEKIGSMRCNVDFLLRAKEGGAYFVAWYNK